MTKNVNEKQKRLILDTDESLVTCCLMIWIRLVQWHLVLQTQVSAKVRDGLN